MVGRDDFRMRGALTCLEAEERKAEVQGRERTNGRSNAPPRVDGQ